MLVKEIKEAFKSFDSIEVNILLGYCLNYSYMFKNFTVYHKKASNISNFDNYLKCSCMLELTQEQINTSKEIMNIFSQTLFNNELEDCKKSYNFFTGLILSSNYNHLLDYDLIKAIRKILNIFQN